MSVYEKLMKVQGALKAPKDQRNNFGKYNYRSCEDILEALKPLLKAIGAVVTITDRINLVGDRYYIESIASFIDVEDGKAVQVTGYAREAKEKKGMDDSQITGATSSYARKYALNGLFAIDNTDDMDKLNNAEADWNKATKKQARSKQASPKQDNKQEVMHMFDIAEEVGIKPAEIAEKMMVDFKKSKTADLTSDEIKQLVAWISQISFEETN